jgi:hypothetical protein
MKKTVFVIKQSEIVSYFKVKNLITEVDLSNILSSFALKPRATWDTIPNGFTGRDIYPWLFRRRLSMLMKPVLTLDILNDPSYIISPGFCTEAFVYILDTYMRCGMEPDRCKSAEMKKWVGDESSRRGNKFTKKAADVLRNLGYSVKSEVQISTIIPSKLLQKDYGDIDIIAWKPGKNTIYLIECKKLLFAKTFLEMAEQLQ